MISFLLYLFYRPVSASQLFFSKYLIFVVLGVAPRPLEHEEEIGPAQPPFSRNICLEEYLFKEYMIISSKNISSTLR